MKTDPPGINKKGGMMEGRKTGKPDRQLQILKGLFADDRLSRSAKLDTYGSLWRVNFRALLGSAVWFCRCIFYGTYIMLFALLLWLGGSASDRK